ncbi:hypothetical protein [Snodgrassella sp. ESL0324]|uniref:hypothetical protein n=1 Tax=Snodgrassella sp. ESL0324 TaxID=2705033 RepID=UPI00351B4DAC
MIFFLIQFARAWGLAVYKNHDVFEIRKALAGLKTIMDTELELHIQYCNEWCISEQKLSTLPEAKVNIAYSRYILDAGQQRELLDLHVALVPYLIGD